MTDTYFDNAIEHVLTNEGGYNDIEDDLGGATNFGISLRFLKLAEEDIDGDGHIDAKDIHSIDRKTAKEIYKTYFWDHYKLEKVNSLTIATKMLDMFVNMRGKTAAKICQRALINVGFELNIDGILGTISFTRINSAIITLPNSFGNQICLEQQDVYVRICENNPSQIKFLRGWLKRARR